MKHLLDLLTSNSMIYIVLFFTLTSIVKNFYERDYPGVIVFCLLSIMLLRQIDRKG